MQAAPRRIATNRTLRFFILGKIISYREDNVFRKEYTSTPNREYNKQLRSIHSSHHFEPVGFELLPEVFTHPQLQNIHESILEVKFGRRNFANQMKHYEILVELPDDSPRYGAKTPVKYRFDKEYYERLKGRRFQLES